MDNHVRGGIKGRKERVREEHVGVALRREQKGMTGEGQTQTVAVVKGECLNLKRILMDNRGQC